MSGKKFKTIQKEIAAPMTVADAVAFLKKNPAAKFDETVELHVRLGVDPQKSDQMVRSAVTLPGGAVKKKNIVVFTEDEAKQKAIKQDIEDFIHVLAHKHRIENQVLNVTVNLHASKPSRPRHIHVNEDEKEIQSKLPFWHNWPGI